MGTAITIVLVLLFAVFGTIALDRLLHARRRRQRASVVTATMTPELVRVEVEQSVARAFTRWWQGLRGVCPGCDREVLQVTRSGEGKVVMRCDGCGFELGFVHHEDAGSASAPGPRAGARAGLPVAWNIGTADGDAAGAVVARADGGWDARPEPSSPPAARAVLSMARALVEGATAVPAEPVVVGKELSFLLSDAISAALEAHGGRLNGWIGGA
jgi:hypothetical protein